LKFHCRCRKCNGRRTLNKHPDDYIRTAKCKAIGCGGVMRLEKYRQRGRTDKVIRAKDRGELCNYYMCDFHYPHTKGYEGCFYHE